MSHVSTADLLDALDGDGTTHREVLETEDVTVELGRYPSGEAAPKNPHTEDEIYYIVSGSGKLRVGDETHTIDAGDVVHVERGLEHDFFDIDEEIVALIVFTSASDPSSYAIREE